LAATSLAQLVLALAINNGHPGRSPYSYEVVPECGTDPSRATCELKPLCEDPTPQCRPPRYSRVRGGWVRVESRPTSIRRFAKIASAVSSSALRLTRCQLPDGTRLKGCETIEWPGGDRALALAALTVALHESGLREDVMWGHPPLGRGPAGEACLMQVALDQAAQHASWLAAEQRERVAKSPRRREEFARDLLGDSPAALGRCFDVGMRLLARARQSCGRSGVMWDAGMFSMYGSGRTCRVAGVADSRSRTFRLLSAARPALDPEFERLLE
jgi:hypothetical protein